MFLLFIINNFKVSLKKPLKTIEKSKMNERKIPKSSYNYNHYNWDINYWLWLLFSIENQILL